MHPCLKKCMARAGIVESWVRGISILEIASFTATSAGIVLGSEKREVGNMLHGRPKNHEYTFSFSVTPAGVISQRL